jgi:hypothetical protein
MACGDYANSALQYFLEFRFLDGIVCWYGDQVGVTVFMLFFFAGTFLALYSATSSVMLPVIVIIVLAPLIAALLPAIGVQFVVVVLILMLALAGFTLFRSSSQPRI